MSFKEGEKVDGFCPKCNGDLFYEMSFYDYFYGEHEHTTKDVPIIACEKCDYFVEYIPEEDDEGI